MPLYSGVWWHRTGRTYGCHVITSLLCAAFNLAFPLGLAWVVVGRQNRSIQDVVLGTSVVYDWDVRPKLRSSYPAGADETMQPAQAAPATRHERERHR